MHDDADALRAYRARLTDAAAAACLDEAFAKVWGRVTGQRGARGEAAPSLSLARASRLASQRAHPPTLHPYSLSSSPTTQLHADLARRLAAPNGLLSRPTKVLVSAWAAHLASPAPALAWKRARNEAAAALVAALACGSLPPPFNRRPPEGGPGARLVVGGAGTSTSGRRVPPPDAPAGPSGRQGWAGVDAATAAAAAARASAAAPFAPPAHALPTPLELQAALGAARERAAELAWRLGEAEARAEREARVAGGQAAVAAAAAVPSAARAVLDAAAARRKGEPAHAPDWWAAAGDSPPSLHATAKAGDAAAVAPRKRRAAPLAADDEQQENAALAVDPVGARKAPQTAPSPPSLATLRGRIAALAGGGRAG